MSYRPGTIKLVVTAGSVERSLILKDFLDGTYPREIVNTASISYSQTSTPFITGPGGNPPYLWTLKVLMTASELATLNQMYELVRVTRPRIAVQIHDYVQPVYELVPSRAIADDASASAVDGMVKYHAQFAGFFAPKPTAVKNGIYRDVTITLQELGLVAP